MIWLNFNVILKAYMYVMRSSKMSLNSNKMKIEFLIDIYASQLELYFGENPIEIELAVP